MRKKRTYNKPAKYEAENRTYNVKEIKKKESPVDVAEKKAAKPKKKDKEE